MQVMRQQMTFKQKQFSTEMPRGTAMAAEERYGMAEGISGSSSRPVVRNFRIALQLPGDLGVSMCGMRAME
jgi:hypothetical protein